MDFKSFSETIKDLIRDYLPEEYKEKIRKAFAE